MPSLAAMVFGILAAASVDADAATPVYFVQRGFNAAITRNGVGDYTLTLTDGANMTSEALVQACLNNNAAGMVSVEIVSTTTLRVRTTTAAGVAGEFNYWVNVKKFAP